MQAINGALRRLPVAAVALACALPGLWLLRGVVAGRLGVDPVARLLDETGIPALQLLALGLLVTPLRRLLGLNLLRFRRTLGLAAFAYTLLHVAIWLALDMQFLWGQIVRDLVRRPYLALGAAALAMLLPLALTSTDRAVRRLGARAWARLHRLVYPAAVAAALHFLMLVKAWPVEPLVYLGVILALLALRLRGRPTLAPGGPARGPAPSPGSGTSSGGFRQIP